MSLRSDPFEYSSLALSLAQAALSFNDTNDVLQGNPPETPAATDPSLP